MTDEDGLELVDYTKFDPFDHILDKTKELFGEDLKLYAVGFDVLASGIEMQYLAYGLIDNSLLSDLRPAFLKKRYHV